MDIARHNNSFDLLRLVFACQVIVSHSIDLSGSTLVDPFYQFTHWVSFSTCGVYGFFVISGYLVFQSLERHINPGVFLLKRAKRIYPGFLAALLFTMIIAFLAYKGTLLSYVSHFSVQTYLPINLLMFWRQDNIAGVFANNPYPNLVNGSLWTLTYEWLFYIIMLIFLPLIKFPRTIKLIMSLVLFALVIIQVYFAAPFYNNYNTVSPKFAIPFGIYFLAGAFLSGFKKQIQRHAVMLAFLSMMIFAISIFKRQVYYTQFFLFPILVISVGQIRSGWSMWWRTKVGDLSYGLYIFAFPIQQLLVWKFHLNAGPLLAATILLCLPLAYFSWHFIEKPFLIPASASGKFQLFQKALRRVGFPKSQAGT